MSYQATVFKVMIASPSDLAAERNVIRAIGKALFKYKPHADDDLFVKAYNSIRHYY